MAVDVGMLVTDDLANPQMTGQKGVVIELSNPSNDMPRRALVHFGVQEGVEYKRWIETQHLFILDPLYTQRLEEAEKVAPGE
jgi:hypothetical protein